jgi:hypothetical protein
MREISVKMRYHGSVTVPDSGIVSGCVGGGRERANYFSPRRDRASADVIAFHSPSGAR